MVIIYKTSYIGIIFFIALSLCSIPLTYQYITNGLYFKALILILLSVCLLYFSIRQFTEYITVDNDKISIISKFPYKKAEIKFNEIAAIQYDYWPPRFLQLFLFYLIPKNDAKKPFKRFVISGATRNCKDLLSEVIKQVGPDVFVEDYIYKYIGKGGSKTVTK